MTVDMKRTTLKCILKGWLTVTYVPLLALARKSLCIRETRT
jgi:hypothetical protein